jgi:signal transduction histidine kinase
MATSSTLRMLGIPLTIAAVTLLTTIVAAGYARRNAEAHIRATVAGIGQAIHGPPRFRLTAAVLEQLKNLTAADIRADIGNETLRTRPDLPRIMLPDARPMLYEPVILGDITFRGYRIPASPDDDATTIAVFIDERTVDRDIRDSVVPILLLGLGSGILATVLSGWIAWRYARAETTRVVGQISDGLAHQLRNAAAGAKLALQVGMATEPVDRESIAVAESQLARMDAILRQFLSPSGPRSLTVSKIDLRTVIDTVVALVTPRARHAGIALEWIRPAQPIMASIDLEQWTHLAMNLMENALDAAGPDGRVTITLDSGTLSIRDTGPGPAPEIAARLFDAFVTGKPGGLGLGLMVAKQVATAHGHTLAWHRERESTVFTVSIPA